jgi:hypothetical protein
MIFGILKFIDHFLFYGIQYNYITNTKTTSQTGAVTLIQSIGVPSNSINWKHETDESWQRPECPLRVATSTGQRNTLLSLSKRRSVAPGPANHGFITPKQTRH